MSQGTATIKVNQFGITTVDVNGVQGTSCVSKVQGILDSLGGKTEVTEKAEMHQQETTHLTEQAGGW